jgi:ABC-2 type transport system permease protein
VGTGWYAQEVHRPLWHPDVDRQQIPREPALPQAITMPLFFGSNSLYPVAVMPGRLKAVSLVNPLSHQADAPRGLLLGTPAHLPLGYGVLTVAAAHGVLSASSLLGRPAR